MLGYKRVGHTGFKFRVVKRNIMEFGENIAASGNARGTNGWAYMNV